MCPEKRPVSGTPFDLPGGQETSLREAISSQEMEGQMFLPQIGLSMFALAISIGAPDLPDAGPTSSVACQWIVQSDSAAVYDEPNPTYPALAVKHRGDVVGGGCTQRLSARDGEWYVPVDCTCAVDRVGWMRLLSLRAA
jgi:hypothetical protein